MYLLHYYSEVQEDHWLFEKMDHAMMSGMAAANNRGVNVDKSRTWHCDLNRVEWTLETEAGVTIVVKPMVLRSQMITPGA